MNSKIHHCRLEHSRFEPEKHYFNFPLYTYSFDLDELDNLNEKILLFGYNKKRVTSIHDRDYLTEGKRSIKKKLLHILEEEGLNEKISRIELITSARYINYVFNPVSFYYCFSEKNTILAIVAEVNNTFGERHLYILRDKLKSNDKEIIKYRAPKKFHVSPFNNMDGEYIFYFSTNMDSIYIKIELIRNNKIIMNALLHGDSKKLTSSNHIKTILKHPFLPHLTVPRILWQAIKLYLLRRLPVYKKPIPTDKMTIGKIPPTISQKICMKILFKLFSKIKLGFLTIELPDKRAKTFGDKSSSHRALINVKDFGFFTSTVKGGDVGFGESYMKEEWDTNELTPLLELLINNRNYIGSGDMLTNIISRFFNFLFHKSNKNSTLGSKKNIRQHYDKSNEFFKTFLDPNMIYSSGYYNSSGDSLKKAQMNKIKMIIKKAMIKKTDHVLEIGCGWGGFAIEAAKSTGCKVTGITVSREQYNYAVSRVKKEKLEKQINIILTDYRHIKGEYDKIVSIEMLEAVGHKYYETFFSCCDRLLKKDGIMVIQTISIPDFWYDKYRKTCDWIQKYIFPGGLLPSLTRICQAMTSSTNFIMEDMENIGIHYAKTLREWRKNFVNNMNNINAMGFEKYFEKKWLYYFSSCEAGFSTRVINNMQIVFSRSNNLTLPGI